MDSLVWIAGRIRNKSQLDFAVGRVRLFTEDRKRVKRMALQEGELEPVWTSGARLIAGKATGSIALAYRGIVVPEGKRVVLEITGRDGGRMIRLRIPVRKILAARGLY